MSRSRSRTFLRLSQLLGNYGYFRRKGFAPRKAWHLASMTLPQNSLRNTSPEDFTVPSSPPPPGGIFLTTAIRLGDSPIK